MFNTNKSVLGIDIGNVITGDTDSSVLFSGRYLEVAIMPKAFEAILVLHEKFEGQVCLVSKCHGTVQVKTRHWLAHHGFFQKTGVNPNHVFFCENRAGKAPICQMLAVSHFIDDRLEVLGHLTMVPHKFLFRPDDKEVARNKRHLPFVQRVMNWDQVLEHVHV